MTEKQDNKILESARNCTFYDDVTFKSEPFCSFKYQFFNAVAGRMEKGYTQKEVARMFGVSERTIIELEKGNSNNLKLVLNYVDYFKHDFALNNQKKARLKQKYIVV